MSDAVYETRAELMPRVPTVIGMRSGTLRLADGRLSFRNRHRVLWEHPIGEMHSVTSAASVGFHIWHGSRCYKLLPEWAPVAHLATGNPAVDVAAGVARIGEARRTDARSRDSRTNWVNLLAPLVGPPPAGVKVRTPWPMWALMTMVVLVAVLLMAAIAVWVFVFTDPSGARAGSGWHYPFGVKTNTNSSRPWSSVVTIVVDGFSMP
ncbi:MAG TPA: hypothetical protein VNQ73_04600 [Ilumatobacter sp.]|nr:hypothetical protein [Ilumatobacter sp.]